jgi:beta-phosphoglucomutase-like phosphatase (HAD superfamily)
MHHVMFDIDGTLVESYELDSQCFIDAVHECTGLSISSDWSKYQHITDSGILNEVLRSTEHSNKELYKAKIKRLFLKKLAASLSYKPVKEILGASAFLMRLQSMRNTQCL